MTLHIKRPSRNRKILRVWKLFLFLPRKFAIQTWLCSCLQYLCLFQIVFECIPSIHDQGKRLVLPNRLLCSVISTSDHCFVSFQPTLSHPHTQIRITLFHGVRISIPNWKPSPNRTSIRFSQIAFPTTVLPKDDRTDSAQEVRLGLPYWTCEGGGDVVGVVTPLVGGVAQAFHDDQVVELRVQLGVQEVEGKDKEEQVEVERERRVKEVRPWMTLEMFMTRLRS